MLYDSTRKVIWKTDTNGKGSGEPHRESNTLTFYLTCFSFSNIGPYSFEMQSDCNLVLYDINRNPTWSSDSVPPLAGVTTGGDAKTYSLNGGKTTNLFDVNSACSGNGVINKFDFNRENGQTGKIPLSCYSSSDFGSPQGAKTASNDGGGGAIEFLDRHNVVCSAGNALSSFALRKDGNNIFYDYTCSAVPFLGQCSKRTSKQGGRDNLNTLFNVGGPSCNAYEVMTQFNFESLSGNQHRFSYTCCSTYRTDAVPVNVCRSNVRSGRCEKMPLVSANCKAEITADGNLIVRHRASDNILWSHNSKDGVAPFAM